ncbi:hypothetical protein KIF24_28900 [Micromonospora sp. Llam7]|uniref:hypothetical protein n=1 Tax=Micromonospora tarapacensis TaxID=2835305 RepID=UPI001C83049A|nr:hypothetical protein [Micromonospora tarapacensis]MBX7269634.1 hypothetical protein [Micromonospora tarapacensis]
MGMHISDHQYREQHERIVARNREQRLAQMAEAQRQADERNAREAAKRQAKR